MQSITSEMFDVTLSRRGFRRFRAWTVSGTQVEPMRTDISTRNDSDVYPCGPGTRFWGCIGWSVLDSQLGFHYRCPVQSTDPNEMTTTYIRILTNSHHELLPLFRCRPARNYLDGQFYPNCNNAVLVVREPGDFVLRSISGGARKTMGIRDRGVPPLRRAGIDNKISTELSNGIFTPLSRPSL